jgi:hypothetical protein
MTALPVASGARRPAFWWGYVLWALYYGVTVFALSVGLYGASLPVWDVVPMFWAFWFCMAIGVVWAFGFVVAASRAQVRMSNRSLTRWLGIPVLGLACFGLIFSGLPATVRFDLSRSSLEQAAVRIDPGEHLSPGWIGLEPIDHTWSQADGTVIFQIPHEGYLGRCGLAYNAHNEPVHEDYQLGSQLAAGWWTWCDMFD